MKRTERGWAGHYICGHKCLFRRNTLLDFGRRKIVVSTVGAMRGNGGQLETIGNERYYETMAFAAKFDRPYWEADTNKQISFDSEWEIGGESVSDLPEDVDNVADRMHEAVVNELVARYQK